MKRSAIGHPWCPDLITAQVIHTVLGKLHHMHPTGICSNIVPNVLVVATRTGDRFSLHSIAKRISAVRL